MDLPRFPKGCASIEQEGTFYLRLRLQIAWDSVSLSLQQYSTECKSYLLLCYSARCQIVPKTARPSQCQGETSPLHNSVKIFTPHVKNNTGGREWRCDFWRNVQSCQGTGNSARETVGPRASILALFAKNRRWSDAPVHMFYMYTWHRIFHIDHIAVHCTEFFGWWSEVDLLIIRPHLTHLTACIAKYLSTFDTLDSLYQSLLFAQGFSRTVLSTHYSSEYLGSVKHRHPMPDEPVWSTRSSSWGQEGPLNSSLKIFEINFLLFASLLAQAAISANLAPAPLPSPEPSGVQTKTISFKHISACKLKFAFLKSSIFCSNVDLIKSTPYICRPKEAPFCK